MVKTRQAIEDSKKAADSAEDAISGGMLPTLDELIEKLEEEEEAQRLVETAWEDLGPVTDTISRQIKLDEERKTKAAEDHVIALDAASADAVKAHEEQEEAVKDAAKAAEQAAEDMAKAAKKIADDAERETARMVASWDTFKVKQDDTVKAMDENGITFGDAVGLMATDLGISTDDMIADLIGLGVTFGDTMGLMEAVGRENLDKVIAKFAETAAAAADTATATAAAATVVEHSPSARWLWQPGQARRCSLRPSAAAAARTLPQHWAQRTISRESTTTLAEWLGMRRGRPTKGHQPREHLRSKRRAISKLPMTLLSTGQLTANWSLPLPGHTACTKRSRILHPPSPALTMATTTHYTTLMPPQQPPAAIVNTPQVAAGGRSSLAGGRSIPLSRVTAHRRCLGRANGRVTAAAALRLWCRAAS